MILVILFISSFEINKVNPFPALTALFLLIFVSNLFTAFKAKLVTSPNNLSLAKQIATFVSSFFPNLFNQEPKDSPDLVFIYISSFISVSFIKFYIS